MSSGLQVFDGSGNVMLDVADKLSRIHATVSLSIPVGTNGGTYTVSGMADDGTWFVFPEVDANGFSRVSVKVQSGGFQWGRGIYTEGNVTVTVYVMRI